MTSDKLRSLRIPSEAKVRSQKSIWFIFLFVGVAAAIALYSRLRPSLRRVSQSLSKPEKPFIVEWCQPVPEELNGTEIAAGLPDYCKLVLSGKNEQPDTIEAAPSNLVYH